MINGCLVLSLGESIAIHKIIQALDTSGIIVERGGKNAEYRSTRINSKGI